MANPAALEPNVQIAFAAGFVSHVVIVILKAYGVNVDDETAEGLPAFLVFLGAYVPDVISKYRAKKSCGVKPVVP